LSLNELSKLDLIFKSKGQKFEHFDWIENSTLLAKPTGNFHSFGF